MEHNVRHFRFKLPSPRLSLPLPPRTIHVNPAYGLEDETDSNHSGTGGSGARSRSEPGQVGPQTSLQESQTVFTISTALQNGHAVSSDNHHHHHHNNNNNIAVPVMRSRKNSRARTGDDTAGDSATEPNPGCVNRRGSSHSLKRGGSFRENGAGATANGVVNGDVYVVRL